MSVRIKTTTLPSTYANGQVLYGADVNKIVTVLREAVNYNKADIDKMLFGYENDRVFPYLTNPVPEAPDTLLYLEDNTADEGDYALVMNGGILEDTLQLYKYVGGVWVYQVSPSVVEPYLGFLEVSADWVDYKNKLDSGYYNGWLMGTDLTGIGEGLIVLNADLPHVAKATDLYINTLTSEVYMCSSVDAFSSFWDYLYTLKAPVQTLTGRWDKDTPYTNDNLKVDIVTYAGRSYYCKNTIETIDNAPPNVDLFTWGLFLSGSMDTFLDPLNETIDYELVDSEDKTYSSEFNIGVTITIPFGVSHGFYAGLNFKAKVGTGAVSFVNLSPYSIKIINFGVVVANYTPQADHTINMAFYCDGMYIYCNILEVE